MLSGGSGWVPFSSSGALAGGALARGALAGGDGALLTQEQLTKSLSTTLEELRKLSEIEKTDKRRNLMFADTCPAGFVPCDEDFMKRLGGECPTRVDTAEPLVVSKDGPCFSRAQMMQETYEATTIDGMMRNLSRDIVKRLESLKQSNFDAFRTLMIDIKQTSDTWDQSRS
jgi:hypothetical protein